MLLRLGRDWVKGGNGWCRTGRELGKIAVMDLPQKSPIADSRSRETTLEAT